MSSPTVGVDPTATPAPDQNSPAALSTYQKIEEVANVGAALAAQFVPKAAPQIQAAIGLEPVVESLIHSILALFRHHKAVVATT